MAIIVIATNSVRVKGNRNGRWSGAQTPVRRMEKTTAITMSNQNRWAETSGRRTTAAAETQDNSALAGIASKMLQTLCPSATSRNAINSQTTNGSKAKLEGDTARPTSMTAISKNLTATGELNAVTYANENA